MLHTEPPKSGASQAALEGRIRSVIGNLRQTFMNVLSELPGAPLRSLELARLLNVNKTLASRIGQALRTPDPLACAHRMPGPEALRILLSAAAKKGVAKSAIAAAEGVVGDFDQLLRLDFENRDGLDAFISHSLPSARAKYEFANKQAMFKAAANLKGVYADIHMSAFLIHPGATPDRYDYVLLAGLLGLRRLRPEATAHISNEHLTESEEPRSRLTIDGDTVEGMHGLLLDRFCSTPTPQIVVKRLGRGVDYVLADNGVGPNSAQDLVFAEAARGLYNRYQMPDMPRLRGAGVDVEQPVRTLILDLMLHEDVWPQAGPILSIYDTVVRGSADPNDRARDSDKLDLLESLDFLGWNIAKFGAEEIPRYREMLDYVCRKMGWNGERFRNYRCRIQYPFYGCQVSICFEPPPRPAP